jgi:hypothetical protein
MSNLNGKWPKVLVLKGKDDDSYDIVMSKEGLFDLAHAIVKERQKTGYWYPEDEEKEKAQAAIDAGPESNKAWNFLRSREHGEYEGLRLVDAEMWGELAEPEQDNQA